MKDPAAVAQKWSRNLGSAGDSIKAGVQAVQTSPTQSAAAAQDRYLSGVQNAVASGKWQRGLNRVSLQEWQSAMINKGVARVQMGATQAVPKMAAFMQQWLPYMDQLKQRLTSMPRGNLQQNIARMVATVEHNASFRRQ